MRREMLVRIIRFGGQNYIRNGWLSVAATLVLALTLFIISFFVIQTYVIRLETEALRDKLDMAIYIADGPSEEVVATFVEELRRYPEVKQVIYLNKAQVIEEWYKFQANKKIKDLVSPENNPLPRTIKILATDPADLETVANRVTKSLLSQAIRKVSYQDNRDIIQELAARTKKTIKNGFVVGSLFTVIAIVFVYNTIRLIIRIRQEEIAIMKLVGATDSFVRGPFLVEGALYGFIAGLITLPVIYLFLRNDLPESNALVASPNEFISGQLVQVFTQSIHLVGLGLIIAAMLLAVVCSWLSLRHHLQE